MVLNMTAPLLSLVIPCYNEAEVLPLLQRRLTNALDDLSVSWEVVFVDDGSRDATPEQLARLHDDDPRFKVVTFSRNFGHQIAVAAGLAHTSGAAVAVLDADLQDPPEILKDCLASWRSGFEVVYCVRQQRKENVFKRSLYSLFYRMLWFFSEIQIPLDSGDFCLMDRRVVDVIVSMKERNTFVRGLRAWSGFSQKALTYERAARAAGETKYPFLKLCKLAADGIFSFSTIPLRVATWFGLVSAALCGAFGLFIIAWRIAGFRFMGRVASDLPGWAAGAVLTLFFGGVQLIFLGVIGEYVGRIYEETKARPRWVVRSTLGFGEPASQAQIRVHHVV
jgi:dolichol-phosphate mannosyltransferase